MSLPANIRVNVSAPFPSTVKANGPVTITKQKGIWTVGFSVVNIGGMPGGVNPTTIDILVWNTLTKTFQLTTLASIATFAGTKTHISSLNSPYTPQPTDTYLSVDTSTGAVEIDLAAAGSRSNLALTIKDITGHAAANNITIKPVNGETIDGYTHAAPLVLAANYDGVKISPETLSYTIDP